jgi:signal transduction histidine kinase/ligand-binding sensor domain-containing protein
MKMCFGFLFITLNLYSIQNINVQNYSRSDYSSHFQNWAIAQSIQGKIIIGNHAGLLIYDGNNWVLLEIPNHTVRSLTIGNKGRIYVGGISTFGYLDIDINGNYNYISLSAKLPARDQEFKEIWQILIDKECVYFSSFEGIFEYKSDLVKRINKNRNLNTFKINNRLYTQDYNTQIFMEYDGKSFRALQSKALNKFYIMAMLEFGNDVIIATYQNGFYIFRDKQFKKIKTEYDNILKSAKISTAIKLENDQYVIGTRSGGLIFTDNNLEFLFCINQDSGLQNNKINFIYEDQEANLWVALNKGVSKLSYTSIYKTLSKSFVDNKIVTLRKYNSKSLLIGNNKGLLKYEPELGMEVPILNVPVKHILNFNKEFIISSLNGIYSLKENSMQRMDKGSTALTFRSSFNKDYIFFSQKNNFYIKNLSKPLVRKKLITSINGIPNSMSELESGVLWIGTNNAGIYKVNYQNTNDIKVNNIKEINGRKMALACTYTYGKELFITAPNLGLYRLDGDCFTPETRFGKQFSDGSRSVLHLTQDSFGNFWFVSELKIFQAIKEKNGTYTLNERIFNTLPKVQTTVIYPDSNGVMWIANEEGLVKYDPSVNIDIDRSFPVNITKVRLNQDSILFGGTHPVGTNSLSSRISYGQNLIRFEFAAAYFKMPEKTHYSYKLEGYDRNWSSYTGETIKDYTGLYEGDYVFQVKAKNVYETESKIARYSLSILAPCYRTWYMYIFYLITVVVGFVFFLRLILNRKMKRLNELRKMELAEAKASELEMRSRFEKEHLRSRISQDLHDEIGSNLSYIRLSADLMERKDLGGDLKEGIQQISQVAFESASAMKEIVWFVDPENDSFQKFLSKMTETAQLMMGSFIFDCKIKVEKDEIDIDLDSKRNVFLMLKEALQNIIKHSFAKHVWVEFSIEDSLFCVFIKDDGIGFNKNQLSYGNGLKNFEKRARKVSASLQVESDKGMGTSILIKTPISKSTKNSVSRE